MLGFVCYFLKKKIKEKTFSIFLFSSSGREREILQCPNVWGIEREKREEKKKERHGIRDRRLPPNEPMNRVAFGSSTDTCRC